MELFESYEYKLRIMKDIFSKKKSLSQKMICFLKRYENSTIKEEPERVAAIDEIQEVLLSSKP